jgi:hypothetical protein
MTGSRRLEGDVTVAAAKPASQDQTAAATKQEEIEEVIKVVIAGASGRMGKTLLEAVAGAADMRLHGALDRPGSPLSWAVMPANWWAPRWVSGSRMMW